jgi:hypothetical protein
VKQPNVQKLEQMCADFNARFPIGTEVTRYSMINPLRDPPITHTRSEAWVMGGHSAMVKVEGVAGGVLLESVRVK